MNKLKRINSILSKLGHVRLVVIMLLIGLFGLLFGTLIRPSEAAQNLEFRISNVERRLDQIQFTFNTLDRRISQLENQAISAPRTSAGQTSSGAVGMEQHEELTNKRIDELQSQVQIQAKMIEELHKMIDGKGKPAADKPKTDKPTDDKKDTTKKPSLAGYPNP